MKYVIKIELDSNYETYLRSWCLQALKNGPQWYLWSLAAQLSIILGYLTVLDIATFEFSIPHVGVVQSDYPSNSSLAMLGGALGRRAVRQARDGRNLRHWTAFYGYATDPIQSNLRLGPDALPHVPSRLKVSVSKDGRPQNTARLSSRSRGSASQSKGGGWDEFLTSRGLDQHTSSIFPINMYDMTVAFVLYSNDWSWTMLNYESSEEWNSLKVNKKWSSTRLRRVTATCLSVRVEPWQSRYPSTQCPVCPAPTWRPESPFLQEAQSNISATPKQDAHLI